MAAMVFIIKYLSSYLSIYLNDFKFLGKKKAAAKAFVDDVGH